MDYKKAYKEARKRAEEIFTNECSSESTKKCCIEIFPDLANKELSNFEGALFSAFSDAWQQYLLGEEVDVEQWTKEHSEELLEAAKEELHPVEKTDEQESEEWSEEDENYIEEIISNLKYAGKNRKTCSNDLAEECIHWFEANVKSLRPQPKQERSEESAIGYLKRVSSFAEPRQKEAEKRFDSQQPKTEWTIKDAKPGDILTTGTVTFIFKSVDKNGVVSMYCSYAVSTTDTNLNLSDTSTVDSKYVHPASIEQRREFLEELLGHMLSYSHWKPSEEQMEALKSYAEDSACLDELYDDLKKL